MRNDMVQTKPRATYDDLLQVPDTKVAELIDGELFVSPRPATPHAFAAAGISIDLLGAFHGTDARSGPGGWWFLPEPELHFDEDVLVPDLAAWRNARMPVVPNAPAITLVPDWLAEIVSPSSARHDRIRKMRRYARAGVAWIWLVDPLARTLESFRLMGESWTVAASHADDEVVRVEPFESLDIPLARWWLG
jgi:Uma2 family endonuclease